MYYRSVQEASHSNSTGKGERAGNRLEARTMSAWGAGRELRSSEGRQGHAWRGYDRFN